MRSDYYCESFDAFVATIREIRKKYIDTHLSNPLAGPDDYGVDVRVFCIFSHAAVEYLLESWCVAYLDHVIDTWRATGVVSPALASLMLFCGSAGESIYTTSENMPNYSAVFLERVLASQAQLREYVEGRNNGIGVKHVRRLFWPLSIDITDDIRFASSLARLGQVRGGFAHKYERTSNIEPKAALEIVSDCIDMAGELERVLTLKTYARGAVARELKLVAVLRQAHTAKQAETK